eukprot:scaffold18284_cov39-Cyclotella_meneghiniana.AAC.3
MPAVPTRSYLVGYPTDAIFCVRLHLKHRDLNCFDDATPLIHRCCWSIADRDQRLSLQTRCLSRHSLLCRYQVNLVGYPTDAIFCLGLHLPTSKISIVCFNDAILDAVGRFYWQRLSLLLTLSPSSTTPPPWFKSSKWCNHKTSVSTQHPSSIGGTITRDTVLQMQRRQVHSFD